MIYQPMPPLALWDGPMMRSLDNVDGAVNFLMLKWPKAFAETELHVAARVIALAVLDGYEPVRALYDAIKSAAQEAGILADTSEPNTGGIASSRKWALTRRNRVLE